MRNFSNLGGTRTADIRWSDLIDASRERIEGRAGPGSAEGGGGWSTADGDMRW